MGTARSGTIGAAALAVAWLVVFCAPSAATPYGMDAVPEADFYTGAWNRYGSDPVPSSTTNDFGSPSFYGLDAIPGAFIPAIHSLKDVLPHETLRVLTRALEGGDLPEPLEPAREPCPKPAPAAHGPRGR